MNSKEEVPNVLILNSSDGHSSERQLESGFAKNARVTSEECSHFKKANFESCSFDVVLHDLGNEKIFFLDEYLLEIFRVLKAKGELLIKKRGDKDCVVEKLISSLKLSGYIDVNETRDEIKAFKPGFEVGSSMKLKFSETGPSESTLKRWQLAADEELEGKESDLIDDSELLDATDLIKPDPESLRVCGTTGKRKACANCSCGLADELSKAEINAVRQNTNQAKSSCGSCYLGDAFRCADCPYLGLPAFKPGEKVIIDNSSDI